MKHLFTLFLSIFFFAVLPAQEYKSMMGDASINMYDVIDAAEKHFQGKDKGKGSGWKGYQRWKYDNELLFYPSGNRSDYRPWQFHERYLDFMENQGMDVKTRQGGTVWTEMGPWHANNVKAHYAPGLGRIDAVYVDPADSNRIYLGARNGGFWFTTNGGQNWTQTTDYLNGLGVSTLAVSPISHDTVLINMRLDPYINSYGIYRSYDAGLSWIASPWNSQWISNTTTIRKLAFNPMRPGEAFVATTDGFFRSKDYFQTWDTLILGVDIRHFQFKAGTPNTIFLTRNNHNDSIYVSTNSGNTWSGRYIGAGMANFTEIAVTAADPNYVYLANGNRIWLSTDGGNNFATVNSNPPDWYGSFGVLNTDRDRVLYGGIDTHLSTDGGVTFTKITFWSQPQSATYIHADLRQVISQNGKFYVGTDGYFAKSPDGGSSWQRMSDGVATREFYRMGQSPTHEHLVIGGSQDNGTSIGWKGDWYEWLGADGMECAVNRSNPTLVYGAWQFGGLHITYDFGQTRTYIKPPGVGNGSWVTPYVTDQNHPEGIVIGFDSLWRTWDNGATWTKIGGFPGDLDDVAIDEEDSDIICAVQNKKIWRTTDGGTNWTDISSGLPNRNITDVAMHPEKPETLVVTYATYTSGQQIYWSGNSGTNWSNISYNLPTIPAHDAVFQIEGKDHLYLGTRHGVFYLNLDSTSWKSYNYNLPLAYVRELEIHRGTNSLRAATFGRGMWKAELIGREFSPNINVIETSPRVTTSRPTEHNNFHIVTNITDDGSISKAWVTWSVNNTSFSNVENMVMVAPDSFVTANMIPNQNAGDLVHYKVYAVDNSGDTTVSDRIVFKIHPHTCSWPGPNFSVGPNSTICEGDSVTIMASGTWHYDWGQGETEVDQFQVAPSVSTNYTVIGIDTNGCTGNRTVIVTVNPNPVVTLDFGNSDTVCLNGGLVNLIQGDPSGGTYTGSAVSGITFDPANAGLGAHSINYQYTDANGCEGSATDTLYVEVCNGLEEIGIGQVLIYPNPSGIPVFNLEIDLANSSIKGKLTVQVLDIHGKLLATKKLTTSANRAKVEFNLGSDLSPGTYFVRIMEAGKGQIYSAQWRYAQ